MTGSRGYWWISVAGLITAVGCAAASTTGTATTAPTSSGPVLSSEPSTEPPAAYQLTVEQIKLLSREWSRPTRSRSTVIPYTPKQLPDVIGPGGISVCSYTQAPGADSVATLACRDLPEGSSRDQGQAVIDELSATPGAIVDWSLPARPMSFRPNDPGWGPANLSAGWNPNDPADPAPGQAIPFARIGLCCAPDGMLDGWELIPRDAGAMGTVNIAVIDSGLFGIPNIEEYGNPVPEATLINRGDITASEIATARMVEAELKARFIGGWDRSNTGGALDPGHKWENFDKSNDQEDGHGTDVAAYALATADNGQGIAGATGPLPPQTVKFGMFRSSGYKGALAKKGITGGMGISGWSTGSLELVEAQAKAFAEKTGGNKWNLIVISLGSPEPDLIDAKLLRQLESLGVLVIVAAGNERSGLDEGYPEYGINPIEFPGADPHVISVASWGSIPEDGVDVGKKTYRDITSEFSSVNPFVDITAPGSALPLIAQKGKYNDGIADEGTSYSAPIVAGMAATKIALSGNDLQCPEKTDPVTRAFCVEKLRALILAATVDISGVDETSLTQGSGVIQAPALYTDSPSIKVPAQPLLKKATATVLKKTQKTTTINLDLAWESDIAWADGSLRTADEIPAGYGDPRYRLYVDGDPTRQVVGKELRPDAAAANRQQGSWLVPKAWEQYRIPFDLVSKSPHNFTFTVEKNAKFTVSLTEIAQIDLHGGTPRRQVESLPFTLECEAVTNATKTKSTITCK